MKKLLTTLALCAGFALAKPIITVSIMPQEFLLEELAGSMFKINTLAAKGADPHTFEPKPLQMALLEKSDIYFSIGIEFEDPLLPKFKDSYKHVKFVPTQEGIELIPMADHHHSHSHDEGDHFHDEFASDEEKRQEKLEHAHGHGHGHGHGHSHHELDPHIWLDPMLVKIMAQNMSKALCERYPEHEALFKINLAKFEQKADALDAKIKDILKDIKSRDFMVYHPGWGYYAKRYNLVQHAVEIEGKEPKPKDLALLIEEAKEHKVKIVFVAPQFSKKAAQEVAKQVGATVVEIDNLAKEWDEELIKTTQEMAKALN